MDRRGLVLAVLLVALVVALVGAELLGLHAGS
jgi:hypothetical protein